MSGTYPGKRLFDLLVGTFALCVALPVIAMLAVLVKIDSPGSALYAGERVGRHERPFRMWKIRSMCVGADSGAWFTSPNDERVTRIGRFIRRTSLDELPNLLNVLTGQMSLVGPRPAAFAQLAAYSAAERAQRAAARPGLTGLAQVMGRSDLTAKESTAYDLQYVRDCSLLLDLRILSATITTVLSKRGTN